MILPVNKLINPLVFHRQNTTAIPIKLCDVSVEDAVFWDRSAAPYLKPPANGWDWEKYHHYHNAFIAKVPYVRGMMACIRLNVIGLSSRAIGMMWCLGPTSLFSNSKYMYVSYLCKAPDEVFAEIGIEPLTITAVMTDAAIQFSLLGGCSGRILFHADPLGNTGLLEYYVRSGFTRVPETERLMVANIVNSGAIYPNDGRFFATTPKASLSRLLLPFPEDRQDPTLTRNADEWLNAASERLPKGFYREQFKP